MAGSDPPHGSWQKSSPELVEQFEAATAALLAEPGVERRQMFGYPACFVGGNMFTGLHQERWVVRLAEADRETLAAVGGTAFEPMPGRPMTGFLVLPDSLSAGDAVVPWLERALAFGRSLPAKAPKVVKVPTAKARKGSHG